MKRSIHVFLTCINIVVFYMGGVLMRRMRSGEVIALSPVLSRE
jgi:hypothetical protein